MPPVFPLAHSKEEFEKFNDENRCSGVYTEIIIDAPPSAVRSIYVDLERHESWDPFLTKLEVKQGSMELGQDDGIETRISVTLDMKMDGNTTTTPSLMYPKVFQNDEKTVVWGMKYTLFGYLILGVDHAHMFLPSDDTGKSTKLIHYERFGGLVGKYLVDKDVLLNGYGALNEALKKLCEEEKK